MKQKALNALAIGADFVELRFDHLRPGEMNTALSEAGQLGAKSVFTLRSKSEGGRFVGSELERIAWLRKMAEQRPMFVDVELETLRQNDELADFFENQKTPILVSWHDYNATPSEDSLADILSEMRVYSNFVKVVTTAKSTTDAIRLLDLYESTLGLNAIIFAMGEAGIISRVLCTVVGNAPFTYASLDSALAPGQLAINEMRRLYDMIERQLQ